MKTSFTRITAAFAALLSAGAFAATGDGVATMNVSATISPECSVGNVQALAFGTLSMLSNGTRSTADSVSGGGTFDAICTAGTTTPTLTFVSAHAGTGGKDFQLVGTDGSFIAYTLKESGAGGAAIGTSAAAFTDFAADGDKHSLQIVGTILAADKDGKPMQSYSDVITITASYGL
jgi:spore coat protein U-like protein